MSKRGMDLTKLAGEFGLLVTQGRFTHTHTHARIHLSRALFYPRYSPLPCDDAVFPKSARRTLDFFRTPPRNTVEPSPLYTGSCVSLSSAIVPGGYICFSLFPLFSLSLPSLSSLSLFPLSLLSLSPSLLRALFTPATRRCHAMTRFFQKALDERWIFLGHLHETLWSLPPYTLAVVFRCLLSLCLGATFSFCTRSTRVFFVSLSVSSSYVFRFFFSNAHAMREGTGAVG
jgi:hypothetical protein